MPKLSGMSPVGDSNLLTISPHRQRSSPIQRRQEHEYRNGTFRSTASNLWMVLSVFWFVLSLQLETIDAFTSHTSMTSSRRIFTSSTRSTSENHLARATTRVGVAKSGGKMIETEKEFAENVLSKDLSRPVLVFYTAPWCGPCRLTVPVVKDVMKQYSGDLDVVEVCTDDLAEVAEDAGVLSIPTIQFYYDGSALESHSIVGCVAKSVLSNAVERVIEDVAQIKQTK